MSHPHPEQCAHRLAALWSPHFPRDAHVQVSVQIADVPVPVLVVSEWKSARQYHVQVMATDMQVRDMMARPLSPTRTVWEGWLYDTHLALSLCRSGGRMGVHLSRTSSQTSALVRELMQMDRA